MAGTNLKDAADKALKAFASKINKTREGKAVKTKRELVNRKTSDLAGHRRAQERLAEELRLIADFQARTSGLPDTDPEKIRGLEMAPSQWQVRDAERAIVEIPKVTKQLARAEANLADAERNLHELLASL